MTSTSRTARCGPACRVVWQGSDQKVAPYADCGPDPVGQAELKGMEIDGQSHCVRVTYRADIDPAKVSICHCTDCQSLTGSPYPVTVICSAGQIRITGATPKFIRRPATMAGTRFQHFCEGRGSRSPPAAMAGRTTGASAGQHPPSRSAQAGAADLVPLRRAMDQRYQGFARTAGRLIRPNAWEIRP